MVISYDTTPGLPHEALSPPLRRDCEGFPPALYKTIRPFPSVAQRRSRQGGPGPLLLALAAISEKEGFGRLKQFSSSAKIS